MASIWHSTNWLTCVISWIQTGCQGEWYRNHFPVIFETNMSQYFNEQIYNDMKQSEFTFPTIEFSGYGTSAKVAGLSHIFNSEQVDEIENACGKSVYFNHVVTELIKQRSEDQTVSQILTLSDTAFLKLKRQFENRINKLYTHHLLGDLLDT